MAYEKIPVQSGEIITSDWGNHVQTQYEEAEKLVGNPADLETENKSNVVAAINEERQKRIAHEADNTNPHNVTKAQVGLGNVQNYGIATQAQAEAGTANNVYMTPLRVAQAIRALSPGIKSVQRGTASISSSSETINISISPINRSKAFVIAYSRSATNEVQRYGITAELTSNTNLRITRGSASANSTPVTWEVVEFN